jgi:hypothetical protein
MQGAVRHVFLSPGFSLPTGSLTHGPHFDKKTAPMLDAERAGTGEGYLIDRLDYVSESPKSFSQSARARQTDAPDIACQVHRAAIRDESFLPSIIVMGNRAKPRSPA